MSMAARAEARRKAILSRGTDRLAKLTASARGESPPAFVHDGLYNLRSPDVSSDLIKLLVAGPQACFDCIPPNPCVSSEDQQKQFLDVLIGRGGSSPHPGPSASPRLMNSEVGSSIPLANEPLTTYLSSIGQTSGTASAPAKFLADDANTSPTRLRKSLPLVHLVLVWSLFAYFAFWEEPMAFDEQTRGAFLDNKLWGRWGELLRKNSNEGGLGIQVVPFFWAFITLQIALHFVRVFYGFDTVRQSTLLSIVLPHLPMPLPQIILNGLKYFQMGGVFLDDLAGLIVGIGLIVWVSGWLADV